MDIAILIRLAWAIGLIAVGIGLYWAVNHAILIRNRDRHLQLEGLQPGKPAILYFTTPTCAPCRTVQRPALNQVSASLGDGLQIIEIDAAAHLELASQWRVLSVPTTFILDAGGQPRHVNHGATGAEKLLQQLGGLILSEEA
jgi:thiol-disulfide isomerase/thioredoxin